MDSVNTEPDSGSELYSASDIDSQHIDIEDELKHVLVSFP
jgi:hypothetical protein